MGRQKAKKPAYFANYWENDQTMNPVVVRIDNYRPNRDHQMVTLPNNGGRKQVHIHELGAPHVAW